MSTSVDTQGVFLLDLRKYVRRFLCYGGYLQSAERDVKHVKRACYGDPPNHS